MLTIVTVTIGVVIAFAILSTLPKLPTNSAKGGAIALALIVFVLSLVIGSFRYVASDEVGIVIKNVGTKSLPAGSIIAVNGEMGPQARILAPGWHPWLWPGVYTVKKAGVTRIQDNTVGLIVARDGQPLPPEVVYAPEWKPDEVGQMLNAMHFLTDGAGHKGPQTTVLTPGSYRINTALFEIREVSVTNVEKATVGVIKSNVGARTHSDIKIGAVSLVDRGEVGIWRTPFKPGKLYLHTDAFEVTMISTELKTTRYTKADSAGEESEITVRSIDGFTFPVDVRIEYQIDPGHGPLVVANFGDDGAKLRERLNSVVRAVFRNNAEGVKALDYVRQRSIQEQQSREMIASEMQAMGVTVTAVRIGDVGDEKTLGSLLKTQTDREIAVQEQITFQEQQRAAEQQKALSRTLQEAEEEKRLATAQYQVQIAEREKERQIIGAEAQGEQIRIEAEAQSQAFKLLAEQIGRGNAALIEQLKIIGESGIQITPRVMVVNSGASSTGEPLSGSGETTALIGTMLDSMLDRSAGTN